MIDTILKETKPKMEQTLQNFRSDISKVRTGRANPSILDGIVVSYYGANSLIKELATISVPEANQITIKPWDRGALSQIEAAIKISEIGLSPINDGQQIRLVLPPMTEERRRELATQIKKMGEEAKVSLRNIRRDTWDKVQTAEKNSEATEDDRRWAEEELNKMVTQMNKDADMIVAEKEAEIMKI